MTKEAKVEFGIVITKPWSTEMYDHNEDVAEVVREKVLAMWQEALDECRAEDEELDPSDVDWGSASDRMKEIQTAITCYGFGYGYTIESVSDKVMSELEDAPLYRLNEIAEELELDLEKVFVGFN